VPGAEHIQVQVNMAGMSGKLEETNIAFIMYVSNTALFVNFRRISPRLHL